MKEGFKLMRERLASRNFIHEYLLHLAIVYRVLRCAFALLMYVYRPYVFGSVLIQCI